MEFIDAKSGYDLTKLGKYFSALSNEANLKCQPSTWLVFKVNNHRQVVGSNDRPARRVPDPLKEEIADKIKVVNLLTELRRNGRIENRGSDKTPEWVLLKNAST